MHSVQSLFKKSIQGSINIALWLVTMVGCIEPFSHWRLGQLCHGKLTPLIALPIDPRLLMLSISFTTLAWWSTPGVSLAGIFAAYVLWDWRRLNTLVVHVGVKLDRMAFTPKEQTAPRSLALRDDELGRRALALESAIAHVRDSRHFITKSLDSLPVAIFVTDLDGQLQFVNLNAPSLTETSDNRSASLIGQHIFEALRRLEPQNNLFGSSSHQHLLSIEQLAEQLIHTASGRVFKIQLAPVGTEKSEHTGWLLVLLEFTLEYLAQEHRNSTLRFLSHDLRAPQSAILALLEMQLKAKDPMPVSELRHQIEQQVRRTLSLTDGLMALDEANSKPLIFEPVYVGAIVQDAIDQAWPPAQYKRIRIRYRCIDNELCVTNGSRELLTRAVFNLLENAVKYSAQGTTIDIKLVLQEANIVLTIRDEGRGIAETDLPHVFEAFSQFEGDPASREGYGLGMAFVSSVMQRHNARIECTSQVSIGTTFILTFHSTDHA